MSPNLKASKTKYPLCVCKLKKALYGFKQSPKFWYDKINQFLKDSGFKNSDADPILYLLNSDDSCVLLALYVDDLVIAALTQAKARTGQDLAP